MAILILASNLFPSLEAGLMRVHYDYLSLEDVVVQSPIIVIARAQKPFEQTRRIEIGEGLKPYILFGFHFKVIEWLQLPNVIKKSDSIIVWYFDKSHFIEYINAETKEIVQSHSIPIYQKLTQSLPISWSRGETDVILFLKEQAVFKLDRKKGTAKELFPVSFTWSVLNAFEDGKNRDRVLSLIEEHPSFASLNVTTLVDEEDKHLTGPVINLIRKNLGSQADISSSFVRLRSRLR